MTKNEAPPLDLTRADLDELQAMQKKVSALIDKRLAAKKQEALDQIKRLAKEYELTYEEVVKAIRTATKRGKAVALFRNPDNPRQTWSGKGEAPAWYRNHPDPEKLRIPDA